MITIKEIKRTKGMTFSDYLRNMRILRERRRSCARCQASLRRGNSSYVCSPCSRRMTRMEWVRYTAIAYGIKPPSTKISLHAFERLAERYDVSNTLSVIFILIGIEKEKTEVGKGTYLSRSYILNCHIKYVLDEDGGEIITFLPRSQGDQSDNERFEGMKLLDEKLNKAGW